MKKCVYTGPDNMCCNSEVYYVTIPGGYVQLMCFEHAKKAWQWDSWIHVNSSQAVVRYLRQHSKTRHLFKDD